MLLTLLLCIPIIGIFAISAGISYGAWNSNTMHDKSIGLSTSIINLLVSLLIFFLFDYSSNQFQFVKEYYEISYFDFYLGIRWIIYIFCFINNYNNSYSFIK